MGGRRVGLTIQGIMGASEISVNNIINTYMFPVDQKCRHCC